MDYVNKIVLITGASRGLGREIAFYFANLGCNLILTYNKSKDLLDNVVYNIKKKNNVNVDILKCNLTCEEDITNLSNFVISKYGKIDILINNAALSLDSDFKEKTKEEFMEVLETNVVGTFLMMQKFMNHTNYVFNISSTDAFNTGSSYNIDYSCSKASINCMTNYFALFCKEVKYIAICPNWMDTESVREMDQTFLKDEMKRIKQDKLINPISVPIMIRKCLEENIESGSIIRIEGDINE